MARRNDSVKGKGRDYGESYGRNDRERGRDSRGTGKGRAAGAADARGAVGRDARGNGGRRSDERRNGAPVQSRDGGRRGAPAGTKPNARMNNPQAFGEDNYSYGELPEGILIGRNPVMEALKSGREITKLMAVKDGEGSIKKILGMARDKNVPVQIVDKIVLDRAAMGAPHQGVVAHVSDYEYCEVQDILDKAAEKGEAPFIMILDGIEDPHNLGAIMRTADASGAHGVIIPKRRAASVNATVEKAAAGAAAYVSVARVTNISQTIEELKESGVWIAAVDMDGDMYTDTDLKGPVAFVIGSEGSGISRLVKEKCDFCVSIPMKGGVNSLNASNAAAVLMYETVRQRG